MTTEEKTFREYTQKQGNEYAAWRPGYPPQLLQIIIDHHTSTGGQLDTIVDVGCGPGQAIRSLAPNFANAIGLDPSEGMISAARSALGKLSTESGEPGVPPIRFELSTAEDLGAGLKGLPPVIADGSVDLLTSATAAHWFDMERFWPRAAQVLKPGGTVALWAQGRVFVHQDKTPNGVAVQAAVEGVLDGEELQPYNALGNIVTRNLYVDLPLPWTIEVPVEEFEKESFVRKEWNINRAKGTERESLHGTEMSVTPEQLEAVLGTASPVTRWREAHPDKAGTEEDILRKLRRRIESLLHQAGVKPDEERVTGGVSMVLLMIKKKT